MTARTNNSSKFKNIFSINSMGFHGSLRFFHLPLPFLLALVYYTSAVNQEILFWGCRSPCRWTVRDYSCLAKGCLYGQGESLVDGPPYVFLANVDALCCLVLGLLVMLSVCHAPKLVEATRICKIIPWLLFDQNVLFWGHHRPYVSIPDILIG